MDLLSIVFIVGLFFLFGYINLFFIKNRNGLTFVTFKGNRDRGTWFYFLRRFRDDNFNMILSGKHEVGESERYVYCKFYGADTVKFVWICLTVFEILMLLMVLSK